MRKADPIFEIDLPPTDGEDEGEGSGISPTLSEAVLQKSQVEGLTKSSLWITLVARIKDRVSELERTILETVETEALRAGLNVIRGERIGLLTLESWVKEMYGAADDVSALYRAAEQIREKEHASNR